MKWLVRIALLFIAVCAAFLMWGLFQYRQAGQYFKAAMSDKPVSYKNLNEFPPRLLEILKIGRAHV